MIRTGSACPSDFGRRRVDDVPLLLRLLLLRLPVRRLHGRRIPLHVAFAAAASVRPAGRLLLLPALAPQDVVQAGDEEDAADDAAPTAWERGR